MTFNSIPFLIFFPVIFLLYFGAPHKYRWQILLAGSYIFYMYWKPVYLFLIIISTLIDFYAGLKMGNTESKAERKKYLTFSLCANLGLLFVFKYHDFFSESLNLLMAPYFPSINLPALDLLLPIGISFYTFQTLSYSIDVYRGIKKPETHLGIFALYVSFFPQLVAGPIERSTTLLPQLYQKNSFDYARVTNGLKLIAWGLFKKVVIADRLAIMVDKVYSNPSSFGGKTLILATIFFAYQIYCDFSGYSDIAIGTAQMLGYKIRENFRQPYFAKSIPEFWRRWHISLSTWFKDYLYIPLGGNRGTLPQWYFNILMVFLLSGMWHGAKSTFVIWGLLHCAYYVVSVRTQKNREKLVKRVGLDRLGFVYQGFKIAFTFSLVTFAWIFFRCESVYKARYIAFSLFSDWHKPVFTEKMKVSIEEFYFSIFLIVFLELVHFTQRRVSISQTVSRWPAAVRWAVYVIFTLIIMNLGIAKDVPFIYFEF